jgi:hypothetical protein
VVPAPAGGTHREPPVLPTTRFSNGPAPAAAGIIPLSMATPIPPATKQNAEAELARRTTDPKGTVRLALSATPARLRWSFDDLIASDGHRLSVAFTASVAAVDEPAERQLLGEVFLTAGQVVVTGKDVIDHLSPSLRAAATTVAGRQPAADALTDGARAGWVDALKQAGDATAFSCGLELLAPLDVEVTSPTLQRERLEQMQRTAAERRSADQVGHFARAAELLKQWDALAASAPSVTPGKVLQQLAPGDRGAMLDTLMMASGGAAHPPALWAVAGPYLIRTDVSVDNPVPQLIPLPTTAGPLRSVRCEDGRLLVGARNGLLVVDPDRPADAQAYLHPALASEHGFTAATLAGNVLRAVHRDGGVVTWTVGSPAAPASVLAPAALGGNPLHPVRRPDGSCAFAVGNRVLKLDGAGHVTPVHTAPGAVVAVLAATDHLVIVSDDGTVTLLDAASLDKVADVRPAGRLAGAALLPWFNTYRLLLATAEGPVACVGMEDQLSTSFAGGPVGVRSVCASAARVAALPPDRQRIVVWNAWDGRRPAAELHVAAVARHRVADVAFG